MFRITNLVSARVVNYFGIPIIVEDNVKAIATNVDGWVRSYTDRPQIENFRGGDIWSGVGGKMLFRADIAGNWRKSCVLTDGSFYIQSLNKYKKPEHSTKTIEYAGRLFEVYVETQYMVTDESGEVYAFWGMKPEPSLKLKCWPALHGSHCRRVADHAEYLGNWMDSLYEVPNQE